MRFKSGFLVGLGTGYVFGTKAGQERYQQIVDAAGKLRENPGVQRLTGEVNRTVSVGKDRVTETAADKADQAKETVAAKADQAKETVASKADQAKEAVASKVGSSDSSTRASTTP
jgi:hypothetical protein